MIINNIALKIKYIIDYLFVINQYPGESSYLLQIVRCNAFFTRETIYHVYKHICIDIPIINFRLEEHL